MNAVAAALCCLGALTGVAAWAQLVPTRALGRSQSVASPVPLRLQLFATLLLQAAIAVAALGWSGGLFLMAGAWMVLGWAFSMALNAWPTGIVAWAHRVGWAALTLALLLGLYARFGE